MAGELAGALIGLGGAVFGAVGAGAVSLWTLRQTQRSGSVDEFRDVVQKLIDLRLQTAAAMSDYANDPARREFVSGAVNNKRQLYKSTAARMVRAAASELTANDLATLAYEYQTDSEFPAARQYYLMALDRASGSSLERVFVLRMLGQLLLLPTPVQDRGAAETYMRQAIELTDGRSDDYSRYVTGYSYEMLAAALRANGDPGWEAALRSARARYEAMTPANPQRAFALEALELRRRGEAATMPPPRSPPAHVDAPAGAGQVPPVTD